MIKITNKQLQSVRILVKDGCANYIQGECVLLGIACPQLNCKVSLCSYFKKSVLSIDQYLYYEIVREDETFIKKCEKCGITFTSKSQNKRYCVECAKKQTKFNKKKYMQITRAKAR